MSDLNMDSHDVIICGVTDLRLAYKDFGRTSAKLVRETEMEKAHAHMHMIHT